MSQPDTPPTLAVVFEKLSPYRLFMLFTHMAMLGFGGVLPWAYRILVERREILSKAEFRELLAFAQILPGPVICNISVIVGHRHAGIVGSVAALAGVITAPLIIVIMLGIGYRNYGDLAPVRQAVAGMAAVAAGLILTMGLKLARDLPRRRLNVLFAGLMFVAVALMRWPLPNVIAVLVPLALLGFWKRSGK